MDSRTPNLKPQKATAISQLHALAVECAEEGWDGDDAAPVDATAVRTATDFVRVLPADFPLPEFAAEPDGSISLDWIESKNRLLSLSVGATHRLPYAWIDGPDTGHGVVQFDGEEIPLRIIEIIRSTKLHGGIACGP